MGDIRPEFVFMGYLAEGPAHGYHIYRSFKEDLEGLWHISESQMYASLKRLEKRGWIVPLGGNPGDGASFSKAVVCPEKGEGRQNRQSFALTPEGLAAYDAWLKTPTAASPRLLKLEFISRLYFAFRQDVELAYMLIEAQRLALEAELEGLTKKSPKADQGDAQSLSGSLRPSVGPIGSHRNGDLLFNISILAKDFRIRQLKAALEWLKALL